MSDPRNPYAPPATHVADRDQIPDSTDSGRFIPNGRSVPAGRGAAWIGDAWRILRANPGTWAAMLILMIVAWFILSMIPVLNFFVQLLAPFFVSAIALAADQQRRTGTFDLKVMVEGFERKPLPLLVVGGTGFLAGLVFLFVLALSMGTDIVATMMGTAVTDPATVMSAKFWLAFLIALALVLPVGFATYLAPQLILLHDQSALTAMKMSLIGCVKNILPGIVFGILAMLLLIASAIPLLLGLLITIPIMAITNYAVYRDIFVEENA